MGCVMATEGSGIRPAAGEPIVILLVDDDEDCRALLREAIAHCGIGAVVHEVGDGQSGLDFVFRRGRYADAPRPALIYLDIEMPGMTGQEVLKAIKGSPEHREIPVVMMTGMSDEEQMELAARNGANSYTIKPASAEQFIRTVQVSASYWTMVHQYPQHHLRQEECRR
jgi:CheY-like chemotaxis protein